MQILHDGDLVSARRQRWRVVDVRVHDDCQAIALTGVSAGNLGNECRLLTPFDRVEPIEWKPRVRLARPGRWRRALRALVAGARPPGALTAAARARIDLLPHQLEPALAVVRGRASRILIADEVGLGKTIQAGLIIAELRARAAAERVLILTPAGLRDQWARELGGRFSLDADVVDFARVRERVATLPAGTNPWATWPIVVSSIDYVKRPEILRAVLVCSWDVLVVDEAHLVAGDTDRRHGVSEIAARATVVVLLTATPHSGDPDAFRSLCAIGETGDRLLIFRRTRADANLAVSRRIHRLVVHPTPAERLMHDRLAEFSEALAAQHGREGRHVWLAVGTLHKRAASCAYSLHQSVVRRLAALSPHHTDFWQPPLDLAGGDDADEADAAPDPLEALALADPDHERRMLTALAAAAAAATARESKIGALVRLLDRVAEPAIVFTEYRDTLAHIAEALGRPAALLHGGLSRQERAAALSAFTAGRHRLLLATDAAGEGLNLHHTCRTVINLELPWSPTRLEQRIGRVDRIGQERRVHVFHLIAAGTCEHRVLDRLRERLARAQLDIGTSDPLGDDEAATARLIVTGAVPTPAPPTVVPLHSETGAGDEAVRLAATRAIDAPAGSSRTTAAGSPAIWTTRARRHSTRVALGSRLMLVWVLALEDGCGHVAERTMLATLGTPGAPLTRPEAVAWLQGLIGGARSVPPGAMEEATGRWHAGAQAAAASFLAAALERERAIAARMATLETAPMQPGLFDRRARQAHAAALAARSEAADLVARRIAALERRLALAPLRPRPVLALLP